MRHHVATALLWLLLCVWAIFVLIASMAALILWGVMFVLGGDR